jgi:hypothetical protein
MIDLEQRQLDQMLQEKRQLIASGVDKEKFGNQCKAKQYPAGSTHAWARDEVWGPIGSSEKEKKNASAA